MTDLLTLPEARSAVNLTSPGQDTELPLFVTGISRRIDDLCGPVVIRTVTERRNGGSTRLWLREPPASSVTSVKEVRHTVQVTLTAETDGTKPVDGYLLDHLWPESFIVRRSGGSDRTFWPGRRNVEIVYQAGRYADTASVDEKFKLAAAAVLRRVWKREQSAWAQNRTFLPDVEDATPQLTFFRAFDPMISEFLSDELVDPTLR